MLQKETGIKVNWLLYLQFTLFVLLLCFGALWAFRFNFEINYTSSELLDHYQTWIKSGVLYGALDHAPYQVMNYPPLYFVLIKCFSSVSFLVLGRCISLLSLLVTCFLIWKWTVERCSRKKMSLIALGIFASSYSVISYSSMFHLQWLAVVFSVAAVYFARNSERLSSVLLSAFLMGLAIFTKQTQIFTGAIIFFWLLHTRWRSALAFALALITFSTAFLLWTKSQFGSLFLLHVLDYTLGTYSLFQLLKTLTFDLLPWIVFFIFGVSMGLKNATTFRRDLRWWYFIGTSIFLFSAARNGSSTQYLLEWSCATALWIMPVLVMQEMPFYLLLLQLVIGDITNLARLGYGAFEFTSLNKDAPNICSQVDSGNSMVIVENANIARLCGLEPGLEPFIMSDLSRRKVWNEELFIKEIKEGKFLTAVLPFDPNGPISGVHRARWTDGMLEELRRNYRLKANVGPYSILTFEPKAPSVMN